MVAHEIHGHFCIARGGGAAHPVDLRRDECYGHVHALAVLMMHLAGRAILGAVGGALVTAVFAGLWASEPRHGEGWLVMKE